MKKAIIIGCGNIGFATLSKLAEQGRDVIVYDIKNTPPQYLEKYIQEHKNVAYKAMNASVESSVVEAFSDLEEDSVDFVLSTVGIISKATAFDDFNGYANVVDINVLGNIIPIKELVSRNAISKGAKIVVIGSTSGHFAVWTLNPYSVSKWILVNICSSLQHELRHRNISLKVVNPSTIKNLRSDVFNTSNGFYHGVEVNTVVNKVLSGGIQSFCPWYYGAYHIIERITPWVFDKVSGLKFWCFRKKHYSNNYGNVLITGASSGLGKELAYRFAGECNKLYLAARNQEALIEIKKDLSDCQCEVVPLYLDLSDFESVGELVRKLKGECIDLIINNAGQQVLGSVLNTSIEIYRKSIRTNCLSHILLTAELIKDSKPKCVVNVLSTTAISGRTNLGFYSSPKAGLWAWTRVLRRRYGNSINVIEVIPATFKSGLHNNRISSTTANVNKGNSVIQSGKMGLTSKDVSESVYKGIIKHRDRIFIPSTKVKAFIALEAIMPKVFRRMFS